MAHLAKRPAVYEPAKQTFPDHDVVSRPKDRKVIRSRWMFRIERGPEGGTLKYKTRVVTQGFMRIKGGIDEPSALAATSSYFHAFLVPAAESNLEAHKVDAKRPTPTRTKTSVAPWSASRRTLDPSAPFPSPNQHLTKFSCPEADIKAYLTCPRHYHMSHTRDSPLRSPLRSHRCGPRLPRSQPWHQARWALDRALRPYGPQVSRNSSTDEVLSAAQLCLGQVDIGRASNAWPCLHARAYAAWAEGVCWKSSPRRRSTDKYRHKFAFLS
jgi:hypothetical protein